MLAIGILLFLCAGVLAGLLASLLGLGGGVIMVPVLYIYMHFVLEVPAEIQMHMAVATSLMVMIPLTINAIFQKIRGGHLLWKTGRFMVLGALSGSLLGVLIAPYLHSGVLRILFIVFVSFVLLRSTFKKQFTASYQLENFQMPAWYIYSPVMALVGALSVLLGIGGGSIAVPFLRRYKMPMVYATALSLMIMVFNPIVGSIGYIAVSAHLPHLPPYSLGYVYLPGFIGMALGSFVGAPMGNRLLMRLSDTQVARIFLIVLLIIVITMII